MAVVLTMKVVPQSGLQELVWDEKQGVLKLFLKSAPEKNAANKELVTFLSKKLGITRDDVVIMRGHTGRRKVISLATNLSKEEIFQRCGIVGMQQQLF